MMGTSFLGMDVIQIAKLRLMTISRLILRYCLNLMNLHSQHQAHLSKMDNQRKRKINPEKHKKISKICLKQPETVGTDILNTPEERNAMMGTTLITMDAPTTAKKRMNRFDPPYLIYLGLLYKRKKRLSKIYAG